MVWPAVWSLIRTRVLALYAGIALFGAMVPGSPPDPMQTTLDVGPTFQFEPAHYIEHLRHTGRKHFAVELEERLRGSLG
jgi:hypothetical protein